MFLTYFTSRLVENNDNLPYHLSSENLDGLLIYPRVPDNSMVRYGHEDGVTQRVSFAPTVGQCLRGFAKDIKDQVFYVHVASNTPTYIKPTQKQVPDVQVTGEIWATSPVTMKCIGIIKVTHARPEPTGFNYGGTNAQSYAWNYQWLQHNTHPHMVAKSR